MEEEIYFPMTCDILTVGHVKCLESLNKKGLVTVGLLTDKALKGYKKVAVPFKDRKYILETIAIALGRIEVVAQDDLNPSKNVEKYQSTAMASGDGFEGVELKAIKKFKLKQIDVKFSGEKDKKFSTSKIKDLICQQKKF